jgi:hypothetical protein
MLSTLHQGLSRNLQTETSACADAVIFVVAYFVSRTDPYAVEHRYGLKDVGMHMLGH